MKYAATHPYRNEVFEVEADSLYGAKLKAIEIVKSQGYRLPKSKESLIGVYLAEKPVSTASI